MQLKLTLSKEDPDNLCYQTKPWKEDKHVYVCVTGLRKVVTLPRKAPKRLVVVFTKQATPDSFRLSRGRHPKWVRVEIGEPAKPDLTTFLLRLGRHSFCSPTASKALEAGYRYCHIEY